MASLSYVGWVERSDTHRIWMQKCRQVASLTEIDAAPEFQRMEEADWGVID